MLYPIEWLVAEERKEEEAVSARDEQHLSNKLQRDIPRCRALLRANRRKERTRGKQTNGENAGKFGDLAYLVLPNSLDVTFLTRNNCLFGDCPHLTCISLMVLLNIRCSTAFQKRRTYQIKICEQGLTYLSSAK
jgi:hypothetical protein